MLGCSILFFILAIIAGVFGFGGIAAASANIAQILFVVFLVMLVISALVGVLLIAAATQGYLLGFGTFVTSAIDRIARLLLFVGGVMFAFPGSEAMGIGHWDAVIIGLVLASIGLIVAKLGRKVIPSPT